ncbi:MAG: ABC transporter permease [Clostridia bacterium]|nr:ABC transporter permease [Clostridia bacterium]
MNSGITEDILAGFRGQLRRNFWGILLLWFGLTISTATLSLGLGMAQSTYGSMIGRLPGDLDRLYYIKATEASDMSGSDAPSAPIQRRTVRDAFTPAALSHMVSEGELEGFFFTVTGRPFLVKTGAGGELREVMAELILYDGYAPLYPGNAAGALARASAEGGIAVNCAFSNLSGGLRVGDMLELNPGHALPIVALVGRKVGGDPRSRVFVPMQAFPPGGGSPEVAVYAPHGTPSDEVIARFLPIVKGVSADAMVQVISGTERYIGSIREARIVAAVTSGIAVLVAVVAFVNAGSFASLWVSERTRGLALRRAVGATPRLIAAYIMSDLVLITVVSLVAGYVLVWVVWRFWLSAHRIAAVTWAGLAGTCLIMMAGTMVLGAYLCRSVSRHEPGTLLRGAM